MSAHTEPAAVPIHASPPSGMRASTARVRGSRRRSRSDAMSATQTEPNADAIDPPVLTTWVLATSRGPGCAGIVSSDRRTVVGEHHRDRDDAERRQRRREQLPPRDPPRPGAPLACRPQLELELVHEVLPHRLLPIRSRAAASPRLTRLRTAACETCCRSAISP